MFIEIQVHQQQIGVSKRGITGQIFLRQICISFNKIYCCCPFAIERFLSNIEKKCMKSCVKIIMIWHWGCKIKFVKDILINGQNCLHATWKQKCSQVIQLFENSCSYRRIASRFGVYQARTSRMLQWYRETGDNTRRAK